jgi:hypothetical protein
MRELLDPPYTKHEIEVSRYLSNIKLLMKPFVSNNSFLEFPFIIGHIVYRESSTFSVQKTADKETTTTKVHLATKMDQ